MARHAFEIRARAWRAVVVSATILLAALTVSETAHAQARVAVLTEPGTPVVATELLLTVGPIDEGQTRAGIAYLAGRAALAGIQPSLDLLGARSGVVAQKDALSFSIIATPDAWEEAIRLTLTAIFRDPPVANLVARERDAVVAELRGRLANPADAATRELERSFFGPEHPWGRPTIGVPETVERLTAAQVGIFVADTFSPDRAFIAVVGPVEESRVREHLQPLLAGATPAPVTVVPFEPDILPIRRGYNSITSWVSASYSFAEAADEEAIRFVVFLATEELSYSPAQRSIYNLWSEVAPRVGGGEARIQIVVPPEEAAIWADRLRDFIADLSTLTMHEDVFEATLRRYRGERIMSLIAPETRARVAARQLLVHGRDAGVMPELAGMTLERLRAAAAALGRPTLVILGPTPAPD